MSPLYIEISKQIKVPAPALSGGMGQGALVTTAANGYLHLVNPWKFEMINM